MCVQSTAQTIMKLSRNKKKMAKRKRTEATPEFHDQQFENWQPTDTEEFRSAWTLMA